MKALPSIAYALGVIAAILVLGGCGNENGQPQFVSAQVGSRISIADVGRAAFNPPIVAGEVNPDGKVLLGTGFTVRRVSEGKYLRQV
jgi:hypothetical protein